MSNIESFSPADQIIRRSGIELPRTGITESLLSPGVIAAQSQESPLTAQIAAAIGATAQLAGTTVQVLARDKALDEREQSDLDRAAAGRAAIDAGVVLPGLATSIAEGQHDELLDDPESFARAIAAEQGGDEFPEAYNEEMFSRLAPALSELAQKRKGVIVGQARAEQSENVIAGVRGSTDLAAIDASISAIRTINPSLSEEAASDYVLDDLMKYAVAVSETDPRRATEMLKTARMRAGDRLKTEQEVAQSRYHSNVHAYVGRQAGAIADEIKTDLALGRLPLDQIREKIVAHAAKLKGDTFDLNNLVLSQEARNAANADRAAREAESSAVEAVTESVAGGLLDNDTKRAREAIGSNRGTVANRVLLSLTNMVDAQEQEMLRGATAAAKGGEKLLFQQEADAEADALWQDGYGALITEFKATHSDGTDFSVSRNARIDETAKRALAKAADETIKAGGTPADALDRQIQMVSKNAYVPPQWEHLVKAAGSSLSIAEIATAEGESFEITDVITSGFGLYKELSTKAPGVLEMMQIPDRTTRIFAAAKELEGIPGVGDNLKMALTNAVAAADKPSMQLDHVKLGLLSEELDLQSGQDFSIARDAAPVAEILVRLGKPPAQAVAQAIEQVGKSRIVVNGWSSRAGNVPPTLKHQFAAVGEETIDAYATKYADSGIRKRDLALRFDARNGLWQIVRESTGLIPEFADPAEVFFSTNSLIERASKVDAKKAEAEYRRRWGNRDAVSFPAGSITPLSGF